MLALNQECCYPSGKEVTWQGHKGSHIFYDTQTKHTAASPTAFLPQIPSPLGAGRIKSVNNTEAKRRHLPESHEEQRRGALYLLEALAAKTLCAGAQAQGHPSQSPDFGKKHLLALGKLQAHVPSSIWAELHAGYLTHTQHRTPSFKKPFVDEE